MADPPLIDIRPDHWEMVRAILQRHVPRHTVWAFGSRAKWTAKDYSDLDLCVVADKPLSFSLLGAMAEDFSDSDLPWKVDVVDWATTSESFRKIIEQDKVVMQKSVEGRGMTSEWAKVSLGDVITLQRGFDLPSQNRKPGKVPIVSSSGISDFHSEIRVKGPGVVTGRYGTIGQVFLIKKDFWPLNTTLWVKDFHGNDPQFASYLLRTVDFQSCSDKSSVPGVNRNDLHRIPVLLPPLPEQKAIAAVLGALDDKIELNRQMNATLEAMARALFQSWFVDFDPVRAKLDGRQPVGMDAETAALFPEHLEESPLGKKPVGWEVTALDNVLAILETGGRPKGGVGGITDGVPSIGAESIVSVGIFDFGKTKFVPIKFYEGMKKGYIESHDVLLYKDGGRPGEYEPHVSMFGDGFPFEKCCINEHVYRLRANERLSQEYLYFWMTSEGAFAEMRIKGTGVAIPGLNSTAVRSLTILVPPRPVIDAFTRQAALLVTRLLGNAKQSRTLATLRDTLLPKLLSGELSVKSLHWECIPC